MRLYLVSNYFIIQVSHNTMKNESNSGETSYTDVGISICGVGRFSGVVSMTRFVSISTAPLACTLRRESCAASLSQ